MLNKKEECRNDAMRVRPELLLVACPTRTRRWLRVLLVLVAVSPASCCLLFATSTTSCHRYPPYLLPDLPDLPSNFTLLPRLHLRGLSR